MPNTLTATLRGSVAATLAGLTVLAAPTAIAEGIPSYNLYGLPGLIDMPTARVAPDATISTTLGGGGTQARATLSFQITPRLSGSFRYSRISDFSARGAVDGVFYDRSFDLRYQVLQEGDYLPDITIGLQDFIGTGLYGGEYLVATKEVLPGLDVTGGIGWGRLGSRNPFATLGDRPEELLGEGGLPTYDRWFRGDAAGFGGLSYAVSERLAFSAEYSSDTYAAERTRGEHDDDSPWNFGIDYRLASGGQLSLYHLYGNTIGVQFSAHINPKTSAVPGGGESAPVPVAPRAPGAASDLGWVTAGTGSYRSSLETAMTNDGLVLEGMTLEPRRAVVRLRNPRYGQVPQAIGRTARAMTRVLPASIETFVIVPVVNGMALSAVTLQRSDLEALEHRDNAEMLARAAITDGFGRAPSAFDDEYPRFGWAIAPYAQYSVFDPESPLRADFGIRAKASYRPTPNLVLSGSLTKRLSGNLSDIDRKDDDALPLVRTEKARYAKEGDPAIETLTLAHYGRVAPNVYSRVTAGYLEEMYAGVSGELLWKPVDSRLALGAEVNYVKPRDFDQMLGLRSSETRTGTIPDVNGHVSAYYDFGNGFHGQLDVGSYLAGDLGATVALDREFVNGWRVGAYATVTNTKFEDFGEGSFDKGIRITIPLGAVSGQPSTERSEFAIQSLTRDGGARLNVDGRLYEEVRSYHQPEMAKSWGKFWR
ncbi:YjbH domain-containing protein [Marinovum sp.]|uniref:YjbH domain-containing protein n=1 Tax=Marinovum sp. TaxID=2024839 RepID=UPI002B26F65C|nr:YjbH domain-containing protein [Marinovum sp.]